MKKIATILIILAMPFFGINLAHAQCTPDASCVDTGDPGQMCPDSLVDGMVNVPYMEVITVLPPPSAVVSGFPITLSHIKIVSVSNLPPGLTYQSNAPDDLFEVGTNYCILIDGTPSTEGIFTLEIEVMPYLLGFPTGTTVTDSTSLFIKILPEANSVAAFSQKGFSIDMVYPNPTTGQSTVLFSLPQPGAVQISVSDGLGREIIQEQKDFPQGENSFSVDASSIMPGLYYYSLTFRDQSKNGILMKQ
ncbi:MAG: T9SS type A sorting domain-containing protein [Bacteroidales bacterium]|nr:T9SS type A sorting domain-containing protein [Bacteroidales bacterium]MCF8456508.1 T9SS type A sorting domain-containing protein [Bacteroidales bacterium]